jgi:hypothetical protein
MQKDFFDSIGQKATSAGAWTMSAMSAIWERTEVIDLLSKRR